MKKILICLATICCCVGCTEKRHTITTELDHYRLSSNHDIIEIEIKGHSYLVWLEANRGGITHAEHCQCKNNKLWQEEDIIR